MMQPDADPRTELTRLMNLYGSNLLRMCRLHLRDEGLAEDAVQETFIKAYRKLDSFRGESSELTWLMGIAINVCRDALRSAWFRRVDRRVDIATLPECAQADTYHDDTVLTEVMKLPARLREVILLRYYQGLTLREAADALHLGLSTVKARQQKANTILRSRLKEWYFHEE